MYKREIETELKKMAESYPVVTVIGPRQAGKTTLVRNTFPDKPYANLESPDVRSLAVSDPRQFLGSFPDGAILDEVQRVPQLLSYIQVIVDEQDRKGMFILTGSHQVEVQLAVSQSLAGRTAILDLLPMSLTELAESGIALSLDEALLYGGYPRIFKDKLNPTNAYINYFRTYIERDLRELINVKDLSQFQIFVKLCASRIGQLLNLESIGNEVGVSSNTIKHWISILEASFVVIRLQPYFENFGKRQIKSPKLFFTDVGLASFLLEIHNTTQMANSPMRGHLFENLVFLELVKSRLNQGLLPQLYFYRDTKANEVDFIYKTGHQLIPIEVKSSQTFHPSLFKNLSFFQQLVGERALKGYLIYAGDHEMPIGAFNLLNYKSSAKVVCEER